MEKQRGLKIRAFQRLSVMGGLVDIDTSIKDGGYVDVFSLTGRKGNYIKIGVECVYKPDDNLVKQRIEKHSEYFNKLIFCIPDDVDYENPKIEIWKLPSDEVFNTIIALNEIYCSKCKNLFYSSMVVKLCPHCGSLNTLMSTSHLKRICNDYELQQAFDMKCIDNKKNKPKIKILKNPKVIELNYGTEFREVR